MRNDYIIDYNQGTIYFADRHLIGSESRIETDYEYSRFTFKKALYSVTGRAESRIGVFRGYFLRESDLESSPLGGQFTPEEQEYLSQIGAGLDSLLYSGVRYVGEGNGTYRLRFDSQANPYFEYTGQGNGDYFVSFMEAGSLRGSYTFDPTTGAYRYVGANLGDFEPAGEVAAPGREDRIGVDFELNPLRHLRLAGEGALLKRTLNLLGLEQLAIINQQLRQIIVQSGIDGPLFDESLKEIHCLTIFPNTCQRCCLIKLYIKPLLHLSAKRGDQSKREGKITPLHHALQQFDSLCRYIDGINRLAHTKRGHATENCYV